jgi:hypothetical protein
MELKDHVRMMFTTFTDDFVALGTKEIQNVITEAKSSADVSGVVFLMCAIVMQPYPDFPNSEHGKMSESQISSIGALLAWILAECPAAREPFKKELEEIDPELVTVFLPQVSTGTLAPSLPTEVDWDQGGRYFPNKGDL